MIIRQFRVKREANASSFYIQVKDEGTKRVHKRIWWKLWLGKTYVDEHIRKVFDYKEYQSNSEPYAVIVFYKTHGEAESKVMELIERHAKFGKSYTGPWQP